MKKLKSILVFALIFYPALAFADEPLQTLALKNGENIKLSSFGDKPMGQWRIKYKGTEITGEQIYEGDDHPRLDIYGSVNGMELIRLRFNQYGNTCDYKYYIIDELKLKEVLSLTANHCEREPSFAFENVIELKEWQGFWEQQQLYLWDKNQKIFKKIDSDIYPVEVSGFTKTAFNAKWCNTDCSQFTNLQVQSGRVLVIKAYSSSKKSYLIEIQSGIWGWIGADEINNDFEGLPWAD